ncbi:MAG TPA: hypothetical protein DEO88_16855, partial [Syntrophobacteraceae bacterium]|nr:hypothetical protein [Syntrophobacteraceae bacterium]
MTRQISRAHSLRKQLIGSFSLLPPLLLAFGIFVCCAQPAHAAQVTLAWDPNSQPEVTGYKIYWGVKSGSYSNHVDVGKLTTCTLAGLASGTTYYFVATCYTSTGAESGYSNQVSTTTAADTRTKTTLTVNPGWVIEDTADFNADGKIDILWRNTTTGENVVWYMNGAELLGSDPLITVTDLNWKMVAKGDFNSDGKPDILWRNKSNGANVVWYMDGVERIGMANVDPVPDLTWSVVGTGDFNGDGKIDILW